ncbi:MAG: hypothetical protein M0C28_16485 [Candidatus Moduliflexus flocculans]|nr:hypothetical protein [Candidatus Moduliflexus flocculans]
MDSVEVEVARRLGDRLLARLPERLLEAARQGVAARLLGLDRLLEDRLPPLARSWSTSCAA